MVGKRRMRTALLNNYDNDKYPGFLLLGTGITCILRELLMPIHLVPGTSKVLAMIATTHARGEGKRHRYFGVRLVSDILSKTFFRVLRILVEIQGC